MRNTNAPMLMLFGTASDVPSHVSFAFPSYSFICLQMMPFKRHLHGWLLPRWLGLHSQVKAAHCSSPNFMETLLALFPLPWPDHLDESPQVSFKFAVTFKADEHAALQRVLRVTERG